MPPAFQPALAFLDTASQRLSFQRIGHALLVALAYFLATHLGLAFALQTQQVSTLWPPNAVLLAALLLTRPSQWWLLLLAALPAHLLAQLPRDVPFVHALCGYISSVAEALIAAGLIKTLLKGRCPRFDALFDASIFLVAGAVIAPFIASFIDIGALKLLRGSDEHFWMLWRQRLISGSLSTLILVPVVTISLSKPLRLIVFRHWINALTPLRLVELAVLSGGVLAVCAVAFLGPPFNDETHSLLLCTVLPFLLWCAVRFGPGFVNYLILCITLLAICGVQLGLGSLSVVSPAKNVLILQLFLIVTTISILLMTAMICERRRAVHDARSSEAQLRTSLQELRAETAQVLQLRHELTHLSRVAMLGELSGAVAHELNQPLTSILSNAQAALRLLNREGVHKNEISEILADIVAEDKRADAIITRLRTLLRKGEVQLQQVDINNIIQEVIALEHSDLLARNIVVSTQLAASLPAICADRVQIQQVLLNLIINANDAMSGNAPSERLLEITTRALDGARVEIAVRDRGHGINERDSEKIFQAFFTSKTHGLGLGLAICRSIVSAHKGELRVRNNKRGGATFYLTLPVAHLEPMF